MGEIAVSHSDPNVHKTFLIFLYYRSLPSLQSGFFSIPNGLWNLLGRKSSLVLPPLYPPPPLFMVINYEERGATKWDNCRSEAFCARPPPSQGKTVYAPLLRVETFCALSSMVKLQSPVLKLHQKLDVPSPPPPPPLQDGQNFIQPPSPFLYG